MKSQYIVIFIIIQAAISRVSDVEKNKFCANLTCQNVLHDSVCGFRSEGEGFRLKLFENECELMQYGCNVDEEEAYGLINKEYCEQSFEADFHKSSDIPSDNEQKLNNILFHKNNETDCKSFECIDQFMSTTCGIRKDGAGFRVRNFGSECAMDKYNCENDLEYTKIDNFICETDIHRQYGEEAVEDDKITKSMGNITNLVVVNTDVLGKIDNINDTIDTFFAASHVFDLPMKEVPFNTRRRRIKTAGPIKVFVPWIVKPDVISNDTLSIPTLSSCYHRCPQTCPDTYAPVCGVPGIVAREPSIMFQNHCFMDVAQCKMFWENKSYTSQSSSYVEASFLFCMGDEMNAVYRFLPAIRTLQHMGRLKKKGKFRAKLRNFRYVSHFRSGRPKFMG